MTVSALIGTPPATQRDQYILNGMFVQGFSKPPPNAWKIFAKGFPHGPLPHDSTGPRMAIGLGIGMAVIVIITALRLYSRYRHTPPDFGWDDFFVVWAAGAGITWLALQTAMTTYGNLGKHTWDGTYEQEFWMQHLGHINKVIFVLYSALSKISIACFNWRLTGLSSERMKYLHIVLLTISVLYGLIFILIFLFGCSPMQVGFDLVRAGQPGTVFRCHYNQMSFSYAMMGFHIGLDWILLAVPIGIICRLQLSRTKKLQAIIPFSAGLLICIGTVLRMYYQLNTVREDSLFYFGKQNDWSIVDTVTTVCVTSIPTVGSLIIKGCQARIQKARGSRSGSSGSGSRTHGAAQILTPGHATGTAISLVTGAPHLVYPARSSHSSHTLGDITSSFEIHRSGRKSDEDRDLETGDDNYSFEEEKDGGFVNVHEVSSGETSSAGQSMHRDHEKN